MKIILATINHDPNATYLPFLKQAKMGFRTRFDAIVAVQTHQTDSKVTRFMETELAAQVISKSEKELAAVAYGRNQVLKQAAQIPDSFILYLDLDRILYWLIHQESELTQILTDHRIGLHILGRTKEAFQTHPEVQQREETRVNLALSAYLGENVDVQAGGFWMDRGTAEYLAKHAQIRDYNSNDTEWPVLAKRVGIPIYYHPTQGLAFETAYFAADEISKIGYNTWIKTKYESTEGTEYRRQLAQDAIEVISHTALRPL